MNIAQVALCTADLPRTVRILIEALGFRNAGGRPRWGADAAVIQDLPSGDDTSLMMWWLVGEQDFVQIELFQHFSPVQRPRSSTWQPSALGWVRFGVRVPDLNATVEALALLDVATLTAPRHSGGARRVCFVEPGTRCLIELIEVDHDPTHETGPGPVTGPAIAYATASVADLEAARQLFDQALGLTEVAPDAIHDDQDEALWDLAGAQRKCAVFLAADTLLEFVQYQSPWPQAPQADALLSDQGMMNVAVGFRQRDELVNALDLAMNTGATATTPAPEHAGGVYLRVLDGLSLEMLLVPPDLDEAYGFEPQRLGYPRPSDADGAVTS